MDALGPHLGREKVESLLGCGSSTESDSSPGIDTFCPTLTWEGGRDSKLNIPLESQRWMESRSATFPSTSHTVLLPQLRPQISVRHRSDQAGLTKPGATGESLHQGNLSTRSPSSHPISQLCAFANCGILAWDVLNFPSSDGR